MRIDVIYYRRSSKLYLSTRGQIFYLMLIVTPLRAIGGAILVLMICATVYEYRSFSPVKDIESSSASNNNDKTNDFTDKNLNEDRRIAIVQENGQELIEKGTLKQPQKETPVPRKDSDEGR